MTKRICAKCKQREAIIRCDFDPPQWLCGGCVTELVNSPENRAMNEADWEMQEHLVERGGSLM